MSMNFEKFYERKSIRFERMGVFSELFLRVEMSERSVNSK